MICNIEDEFYNDYSKGGVLNMGKGNDIGSAMDKTMLTFNTLMVIGFLGIIWLMIYGNLSGNLGFAPDSIGDNNTQSVIDNLTQGAGTFFGFSNVLFTITAIVLLITILMGLLFLVLEIARAVKERGSSSSFSG